MSQEYLHEDLVKTRLNYLDLFLRMWPYFKKFRKQLFIVTFLVIAVAVVSRLQPTWIGLAIDNGLQKKDFTYIKWMAITYGIGEFALGLLTFYQYYLFQKLGNHILFDLRQTLIQHIQRLPMTFFDKTPAGRIVTRMTNDTSTLGELFSAGLISVFINVISIIAILIAMSLISLRLTFISLCTAPIFFVAVFFLSKKVQITLRETKKNMAKINAYVAENINGMKIVQLYDRTIKNQNQFNVLSKDYRKTQMHSVFLYALLWPIVNFFSAVVITFALYWGGIAKMQGALQVGAMVAFFMHIQDLIPPLRNFLERYQMFQNSLTSGERIFTLLDEVQEIREGKTLTLKKEKGKIEFKNLSFQYEPHLPYAIDNLNFEIQSGESIAIVGHTGSGKTTLISLLQRFYRYNIGEILIDNESLNELSTDSIRKTIGVVQQDNFIFRGSLFDNITLLNPDISEQQAEKALVKIGGYRLIANDSKGLHRMIEERGTNLSVGERQLIAFARVLAFNSEVMVLDEATANIDSESELLIQKATIEVTKNRTCLIIAHRLSTIRHCDKIMVLHKGKLIEVGRHEELLAKRGAYYEYYQKNNFLKFGSSEHANL